MHATGLAGALLLLVGATTARSVPGPQLANRAGALVPLPADAPKFRIDAPGEALSKLSAKAEATPSAVNLDHVPLERDSRGRVHETRPTATAVASRSLPKQPVAARQAACPNPTVRPEWRNLDDGLKQQYVAAVACLTTQPARSGIAGAETLWDDFAALHQQLMPTIHLVGSFLPWHRWFLHIFHQELGRSCNYTGPLPWWDETRDAGRFASAPMFTDQYYGSIPENEGCVPNGRFRDLELHIGPGTSNRRRCLARNLDERTSARATQAELETCYAYQGYADWAECIEGTPHGVGHVAVGSVMNDVYASPQDPVFFLHHAFVDRAWAEWQGRSPANRTQAIGGYTTQGCTSNPTAACQMVTLDTPLRGLGFYPDVPVRDVMDTRSLCYEYDY